MEKLLIEAAYQKYSGRMLQAMIRFSRDEAAARDAVSQAFTQALMNQTLLETMPEPAVRAWLYAAARNALVDMKRKEARVTVVQELPETEDPQPDPTDRLLVKSMLDRLNSELRMPVYLKYYQDVYKRQAADGRRQTVLPISYAFAIHSVSAMLPGA